MSFHSYDWHFQYCCFLFRFAFQPPSTLVGYKSSVWKEKPSTKPVKMPLFGSKCGVVEIKCCVDITLSRLQLASSSLFSTTTRVVSKYPGTHVGIKYKYNLAKWNLNTNTLLFHISIQIQLQISNSITNTLPFLFKYNSITLPVLKFVSNMIQIRGPCFHYCSSVS